MDFLWHSVSEEEKKMIKEEAKKIMDAFAKAISKADNARVDENLRRKYQVRKEGKEQGCDEAFRKMFLDNAPNKDGDIIVAEKGKWKT